MNFEIFLRTLFLTENLRWLHLSFASILSKWFKSCPQISFPKVFEIIGRMLIGLSFSLRFPEPYLITTVTLANLEDAGNFDESIYCMKVVRIQAFIGPYFNTYSHSNCFVNFKACIFSKIISIFFWYSYMWVWFLHYFMKFWCLQERYFLSTCEK